MFFYFACFSTYQICTLIALVQRSKGGEILFSFSLASNLIFYVLLQENFGISVELVFHVYIDFSFIFQYYFLNEITVIDELVNLKDIHIHFFIFFDDISDLLEKLLEF